MYRTLIIFLFNNAYNFSPLLKFPSEEPQPMNALPEVTLHSLEDLVEEQDDCSPTTAVGLAKPSMLTFDCLPENADDKEEKLSPQSVLVPSLGNSSSPSQKTRKQGIFSENKKRRVFFFVFPID